MEKYYFHQNGRPLKIGLPELIIQMDGSKTGRGDFCMKPQPGNLIILGTNKTVSVLELTAVKFAIRTFT